MELYLDPPFVKVPKQRKPHPLKGKHQWSTDDPDKRERILCALRAGFDRYKKNCNWGKISKRRVPVAVYDMDGNFVAVCRHLGEAAERFATTIGNVSMCIHGKRKYAGNFQFRKATVEEFHGLQLVKKSPIEKYTGPLNRKRAVDVFGLDGAYLGSCDSMSQASRYYGVSLDGVQGCLAGRYRKAKQYQFREAAAGTQAEHTPIEPYKRTCRRKKQDPAIIKDPDMRNFIENYKKQHL